jgi:acetoacetyl-CoA synthetase
VTEQAVAGEVLWTPPPDARRWTRLGRYLDWLEERRGLRFDGYDDLWRWSVDDLEGFWSSIWEFFEVRSHAPYERVLARREMPGAEWFPGALLNYAEHLLGVGDDDLDRIAVCGRSQTRAPVDLTLRDLRERVGRARAGLARLGVGRGDRVVAYLPNIPETLVAFLATASLGATWASCAPEFGVRAVVDRFGQIDPKLLLTISGYRYGAKTVPRDEEAATIASRLPGLERIVHVPYGEFADAPPGTLEWAELLADPAPLVFDPVPFAHPLFVLFSSGTTGLPKAIVHGHGGILLEHLKLLGLLWDLGATDRLFWPSTTAWMMWNALVSALLTGAGIVTFDGDGASPDLAELWRVAAETRTTMFGTNPVLINAWRKAGLEPAAELDLSAIRQIGTAGSPLPPEGYRWVYDQFPPEVLLSNGTGGTDVCCGFTGATFLTPVWAGEMSVRSLGVDARAFDEDGREVVGKLGELVICKPMPSMPVGLWNDPDGLRLRRSYFDMFPGVWRQGDWVLFTERGTSIVTGRSDATLNRGGVRLGTGDFYAVLEELPEVTEGLVVHLEDPEGGPGQLLLFVALAPGEELVGGLRERIAGTLRTSLSPRHVPDEIVAVPSIPKTLTGKKLELPIKRILQGAAVEEVASRDSLPDPDALAPFVGFARRRRGTAPS